MKSNTLFNVFIVILIIVSGMFTYYVFSIANEIRIIKSEELYNYAQDITEPKERLVYLLQSNILQTSESKELQIAEVASEANEFNVNKSKINNKIAIEELDSFRKFSNGNYSTLETINEPETNIGKLLFAIKTNDYTNLSNRTAYSTSIINMTKMYSGSLLSVKIANMFANYEQPYISNYIAEKQLDDHPCNIDIYTIIISNSEYLEEYDTALLKTEKAIDCASSNIELYEKAVLYADKVNNHSKVDIYNRKIEYLQAISN